MNLYNLFTEISKLKKLQRTIALRTMTNKKGNISEKSREEIKAEREAKKAAKAHAKAKAKSSKILDKDTLNDKSASLNNIKNKNSNETSKTTTNENIESAEVLVVNKTTNICEKSSISEASNEGKSKAELRAERRAKQEAQRAAKQQILLEKNKIKSKEQSNNDKSVITETVKKIVIPIKTIQKRNTHEINLFKHLYHEREQSIVNVPFVNSNIHPAIIRLGTQYANKIIVGSNARCVALLAAVKQLIYDFERPPQADFIRSLEANLQESIAYLHYCRPLAVSMQNAMRHLKWQMTQFPSSLSDINVSLFFFLNFRYI